MELIYNDDTLYINIEEEISFVLVKRLKSSINTIISAYHIPNIEINIINDVHYDKILLNDLLDEIHSKYHTRFKIR